MDSDNYLFNLLFFSRQKKRSQYLEELIAPLLKSYSCNLIKIVVGTTTEDKNTIVVKEDALSSIPLLVFPKLIADLPIYLIWGDDPTLEMHELNPLLSLASRIIYDAHETPTIPDFADRLIPVIQKNKEKDFIDFDWAFTTNWRKILPKVFDTEEKIEALREAEHLSMTYHGTKELGRAESLYLCCWLAAQLNWMPKELQNEGDKTLLTFQNNHTFTLCEMAPTKESKTLPGSLLSLSIEGRENCSWNFVLDPKKHQITLHFTNKNFCALPQIFPVKNYKQSFTLAKGVLFNPFNPHYYNMLNILKKFSTHG